MAHDVRHGGHIQRRLPVLLRGVDRRPALGRRRRRDPGVAPAGAGVPGPRRALWPRPDRPPPGRGRDAGDGRRPHGGLHRAGPFRPAAAERHGRLPGGGRPQPPGRGALRRGGLLAQLLRLLRRRRLPPGPRAVPPRAAARREGRHRHHAPRRRRAALHARARRRGRPARRRHHVRDLHLRPGARAHGGRAHRPPRRRRPAGLVLRPAADPARVGRVARGRRLPRRDVPAGGGGPLELDSWEMVVVATA